MAHEAINYETAMQSAKTFAKGNPFGSNASRLADNAKATITVEKFTQNTLANGDTILYAVGSNPQVGSLRFRVQDPETDLPKMPIGSSVQVVKGSMTVPVINRETQQAELNADGTEKTRLQSFVSFVMVQNTNTAAQKTAAKELETSAETK